MYSTGDSLVFRSYEDGGVVRRKGIREEVRELSKFPGRDLLVGRQGENLSFFDLEGEKVHSVEIPGLSKGPRFSDYTGDGGKEVAVAAGKEIKILDVKEETERINRSLEDTVFVGNGRELLKAVALNQTSFVAEDFGEVEETVDSMGREAVGVGDVSGMDSVKDVNYGFNISRPKYYAGERKQAVYVSAFAADDNASLTFERKKADKDFSNYSVRELQDIFIERFDPNHVAVADLESDKGILTAYMAVKQGIMPVHWNRSFSYNGGDAGEVNRYNGVIQLEKKIGKAFDRIGENRNTVFDGKYISLLEAPSKVKEDPVEEGFLSSDPGDGERFRTDLEYGNLNSDSFLEAGVGRYPENVGEASVIFHRSMEREPGEKAVVASEYLHSSWPVILATGGGGLRHGSSIESVFKEEGFNTTHLVEHRSEPVEFLTDLTPVNIISFLEEADDISSTISSFATESAGNAVENAVIAVKALNYAEQLVEMYYEFQWKSFEIDVDRGIERMEELDISLDSNRKGAVQESVMKVLYAFIWPERHPNLNSTSLEKYSGSADIIYYQGRGNSSSWTMPNTDSSLVKNRYTGENRFGPGNVPELDNSIVWDSSNNAGAEEGDMRQKFLEKGASSYLGFSSVNYAPYSSIIGYNFFRQRKTLGNSLKKGVNSLKSSSLVYSPTTLTKSGVQEKISSSLRLYGNPEMRKDPIEEDYFTDMKSCEAGICTLNVSISTPQEVREVENQSILVSNASSYVLQPGAPVTPMYSWETEIPGEAEIIDVETSVDASKKGELELRENRFLDHGGNFVNRTPGYEEFPGRKLNISRSGKRLIIGVSGAYSRENYTEVVENASVRLDYRSPFTLDFVTKDGTLEAEVFSRRRSSGELVYRLENRTYSRSIDTFEGEETLELQALGKGIHEVEGYYLVNSSLSASDTAELKVVEDVRTEVLSSKLEVGSPEALTVSVENPNSFGVEREIDLQTGEDTILDMFEREERRISLQAGESRTVSWNIVGLEKGEANLTAGNSSFGVTVTDSRDREDSITSSFYRTVLDSRESWIDVESNSSHVKVSWKSPEGLVKLVMSPGKKVSVLESRDFRARKVETSEKKILKVESGEGVYVRKTGSGLTSERGDMDRRSAERWIKDLETEVSKLEKFVSLRVRRES